jgi:endonuclease YncB( thermonuclease family)
MHYVLGQSKMPPFRKLHFSLAILFVLAFGPTELFADRVIEGRVTHVRDIDTIVVAGTPIRLEGLDGPELSTTIGKEGKFFMQRLVGGKIVKCNLNGDRTYDRWVGVCFLEGVDIAVISVSEGMALDCARYSGGRYKKYETPAARSKIRRASYCR